MKYENVDKKTAYKMMTKAENFLVDAYEAHDNRDVRMLADEIIDIWENN